MLNLLDDALESFFRHAVPLDSREVDVEFEPPDREWGAALNRPTVNIFLHNILKDGSRSVAGTRPTVVDGSVLYTPAPTPMEFRYLITAWSARHEDEMRLLGAILAAVNAHGSIPQAHLSAGLAEIPPPEIVLAATSAERQSELWNALDGQLKPGLQVVLRSYLPGPPGIPAGPPTEDIGFSLSDQNTDRSSSRRRVSGRVTDESAIGALVRAPFATTRVDGVGRFAILAVTGDELVIETDPERTITVPDVGGVVVD
ncbi:MAG: DUF4255 domain-containing protein [Acidimicrobiaceae bacterium]|jgi:hypothetical protein|nr:DUF4255 domain-containing protein [Acidimicrobiaceae bacterium]MBT5582093.1 DUF4255 domain-containing protein [Acidimicrobiaceae bacterium]MBT5852197.1 DUF4255 domain-containing protein [Acidimicrobiaceae bacterium]MDG1409993.1 DUF4255 domain-containing protein [Acidimicrobiales bacterium]MDG2218130.1 DUF4255 domain-containing protein [Acidimicrobiales bacterium]